LSILFAVGLLSPLSWIVMLPAMLWLAAGSIWLYRQEASAA